MEKTSFRNAGIAAVVAAPLALGGCGTAGKVFADKFVAPKLDEISILVAPTQEIPEAQRQATKQKCYDKATSGAYAGKVINIIPFGYFGSGPSMKESVQNAVEICLREYGWE